MRISANERNVQREDLPDDEFAEFVVAQGRAAAAYVEVPNGEAEAALARPSFFNALTSASELTQLLLPRADCINALLAAHPMILRPMSISAVAAGVPWASVRDSSSSSSSSSSASSETPLPPRLPSVGAWMFLVARPGLDDAVAYRVARALHVAQTAGDAASADHDGASSGAGSGFSPYPTYCFFKRGLTS